jgi:serine protease Do
LIFKELLAMSEFRKITAPVFVAVLFAFGALPLMAQPPETVKASSTNAGRLPSSFADVARIVEPAVVSIDTKGNFPEIMVKEGAGTGDASDLPDFFRQNTRRPSYRVGSGFIVDKSGYIVTNYHVVSDASRITVKLESGEEFAAKVVGTDEETDIAVLKIDTGKDLPVVKLGNSDKAEVGDWVLAIGSPFGLARTVTAGIVSQTKRETPSSNYQKFIQTDAAINLGNSGGPLVNMDGEVIGVNSQIATSTGDYNGIGLALPSNDVAYIYDEIVKNGKVRRGYLGVVLESVKTEYAKVYGLSEAKGAIVTELRDRQSTAGQAGMQVGDIVVEFDGKKVENAQDLIAKVAAATPDRAIYLVYLRENGDKFERKSVLVKLAERLTNAKGGGDDDTRRKLPIDAAEDFKPFGLTLSELTPVLAETYKLTGMKGLVVRGINPASFIADVKTGNGVDAIFQGDLIQKINRMQVTDLQSFNAIVKGLKKGDAVVLHIWSSNRGTRSPQIKIVQFTIQ